jgi:hypothetical protein
MSGGVLDGAGHLREMGDIHLQAERFAAESFDFTDQILRGVHVAQTESDISSGVSAGESDGASEASRGAGNQGDLAREAEIREVSHRSTSPTLK